jgi:enoyl-CoA hydratase/carnithine racemase
MCSTPPMSQGARDGHLLTVRDGHVLVVTMNRPERRNALSLEMMQGMSRAWDEANADPAVRVVILTGAGGAFCAGADLAAMTEQAPGDAFAAAEPAGDGTAARDDGANATVEEIADGVIKPLLKGFLLDKPLIAAVEGPAIAGGTEILQATDIRIAGESARFGVSEVRWGLYPLGGSVVRLRRQIPYTVAADLLLTGRHLTAAEAQGIGLIGEVVPDGTALDRAREVAAAIAANGPVAVQAVLHALRATEGVPEREAMRIDSQIGMAVYASDDAREGPKAFMEKRTPQFTGK